MKKILQAGALAIFGVLLFKTAVCMNCCNQYNDTRNALSAGAEEVFDEVFDEVEFETVPFDAEKQFDYITSSDVFFEKESDTLNFSYSFDQIPESDDDYIYVFGLEIYQEEEDYSGEPVCAVKKSEVATAGIPYEPKQLFLRYMPTILSDGEYVPLSDSIYVGNPEALSDNNESLPEGLSKKGLLIDAVTVGTPYLSELGVTHGVYNIPLSVIVGNENITDRAQIEFEYDGNTYYFNESWINTYDVFFSSLNEEGIYPTAIILNDWNEINPQLIHPESRNPDRQVNYYQFNTAEEDGVKLLQATALFLADRYSSAENGMVYNWVIANEINQQRIWNYMDTVDVQYYAETFEKSFRLFYNAIKSKYSKAHVYFSLDNVWNRNDGTDENYFNGKDVFENFNKSALAHGNYDWSIAIHPYPVPLTKVNYWSSQNDMTENAPDLTIMNLSTITDMLEHDEFRNPDGEIRKIAITELGYTSFSGEKLQAAAFAYGYKIVDENPYIDMFLLNRQTDAPIEMAGGLALGLYAVDYSEKYLKEVFANIDTEKGSDYDQMIVNILKADSIEQALGWAVKEE